MANVRELLRAALLLPVTVFEGFMDYLSALTHYGRTAANTPVIILNSVVTGEVALEKIEALGVGKVHLYLDRDITGKKLAEHFREQLPTLEVLDHSGLYVGYRDFNAFLMARQKAQSRQAAR